MFVGGKQGVFEVKWEKRPTMKSCDQVSNILTNHRVLFVDMFDMWGFVEL